MAPIIIGCISNHTHRMEEAKKKKKNKRKREETSDVEPGKIVSSRNE